MGWMRQPHSDQARATRHAPRRAPAPVLCLAILPGQLIAAGCQDVSLLAPPLSGLRQRQHLAIAPAAYQRRREHRQLTRVAIRPLERDGRPHEGRQIRPRVDR
jgi:hypothetical protein